MAAWRIAANPMRWYLATALAAVAATSWLPWTEARAAAAIETKAERTAALLLETWLEMSSSAEPDPDVLFARFVRAAAAAALPVADLERLPLAPDTLMLLRDGHYLWHVAVSPIDPQAVTGRGTLAAIEVAAWPRSPDAGGHAAFFHPDDGPRAFTRNLTGHHGLGTERLCPGDAQRSPGGQTGVVRFYRGYDDERWIVF